MPLSRACQHQLERSRRYHPLYGDRLANHLPMALIALDRMGAGEAHMRAFAGAYENRLSLRADDSEAFERALRHFRLAVREHGAANLLREWLPALLPGVAASAFHCMIRLAYAVDAEDDEEVAMALAYWTTSFEILGPLSATVVDSSPQQVAAELQPRVADVKFLPGIIIDRMQQIHHELVARHLDWQPRTLALQDVASFALAAYARQEDFTLLHTVTGTHALRVLLPYVSDRDSAVRWLWQGVLAAYLTVEHDADALGAAPAALGWEQAFAKACTSQDDHVIKLTYTAHQESRHHGNEAAYLAVAARKVLLDS